MTPILSPHYPWADLTCGGERDNNPRRTSGETLPCTFAAFELDPDDVSPQERPPVAGSHLIRLHGAGFRLQFQTASHTSPTGATAGSLLPYWRGSQLSNFARRFKAPGRLFSIGFHSARTVCQDTARKFANPFQVSNLSALAGLAASVGRTPIDQKENRKCPTIERRNPT